MKKVAIVMLFCVALCQSATAAMYCRSNDDCPNKKPCVGSRTGGVRCIDAPLSSECAKCRLATSRYKIDTGNGKIGVDMDCLEKTTLSGSATKGGFCKLDSLTNGLCHTHKLLKNSLARYLVLFAILVIGFNFLVGGGKVNINSVLIIIAGVFLIYGGFQIINIITGVDSASVCNG